MAPMRVIYSLSIDFGRFKRIGHKKILSNFATA